MDPLQQPAPAARPELRDLAPYIPGSSAAAPSRDPGRRDPVNLAATENPLGPSPRALQAARQALDAAHLYPEDRAPALRAAVAAQLGLAEDWVLCGNGSGEVLRLLALAYLRPGDRAVVPAPALPLYRALTRLAGARVVPVPLRDGGPDLLAMANAARRERARVAWVCSPHNPTGGTLAPRELPAFLVSLPPATLVVLDQAYHEYDESGLDALAHLRAGANLVVTRTFSKAYGLAGVRVGYALGRPQVLAPLWLAREPFSVSTVAQAAALGALADPRHLDRARETARQGRALLERLARTLGLQAAPSQANFVLLDLGRPAAPVHGALLQQGIRVCPGDAFGLETALRVTCGQPRDLERLGVALPEALRAAPRGSTPNSVALTSGRPDS